MTGPEEGGTRQDGCQTMGEGASAAPPPPRQAVTRNIFSIKEDILNDLKISKESSIRLLSLSIRRQTE